MAGNEWFSTGFSKAHEFTDSARYEFGNNRDSRFYLKAPEEGKSLQTKVVIFLDDFSWQLSRDGNTLPVIPFCYNEHLVQPNGVWDNRLFLTCLKGVSTCLPCEHSFKRNFMGAMTILEVTPFKDQRTGENRTVPRKLLMIGVPKALRILETKKEKKGNLRGWKYSVVRHGKMDPRIGSDFEPEEHIEDVREYLKKMKCPDTFNLDPYGFTAQQAFDFYLNLFSPMPQAQQEKLFSSSSPTDGLAFKERSPAGGAHTPGASATSAGGEEETIKY